MNFKLFQYALLILFVMAGGWYYVSKSGWFLDREALIAEASTLAESGDLEGAKQAVEPLLNLWSVPDEILLFVANINRIEGDFETAISYLNQISDENSQMAAEVQMLRAEAHLRLGEFSKAREGFESVLSDDPANASIRRQLVFVLNVSGLIRDALPHMLLLVDAGQFDPELLLLLCDTSLPRINKELIQLGLERAPRDPLVQLAAGLTDREAGRISDALEHFQNALDTDPNLSDAWINAVDASIDLREKKTAEKLLKQVPANASQHPDCWRLQGDICQQMNLIPEAIRCYWEAVRIAPDHIAAHYRLGETLQKEGHTEFSKTSFSWANELSHLAAISKTIQKSAPDVPGLQKLANQLLRLNRTSEARAWISLGRTISPTGFEEIALPVDVSQNSDSLSFSQSPSARIDLSEYRIPDWNELQALPGVTRDVRPKRSAPVSLENISAEIDFDFEYENGGDPETEGRAIYEYTGGGIGVLDFDLDGWPDFYLTQGNSNGPGSSSTMSDQLYRNLAGSKSQNVTEKANIRGIGFGQGVAVGDIDNDGFPDIYVANFGRNQLWRNNGDGTFTDITEQAGLDAEAWTTSCAIADLDGDGLPDLFDVNYLTGENLLTEVCHSQGNPRVCSPVVFEPAQDHLWKNSGHGPFTNEARSCGLDRAQGNGLGIAVADFNADQSLELFIANDAVANHYWVAGDRNSFRLEETALISGLAMNSSGREEACMGVAVGDGDGDGLLDLFVTNFFQESNTFYRQQQQHLFLDETQTFELRDSGYNFLGFGAQFLDVDLDGWQDLVVLNGDIDDFSFLDDREERMPPLMLRNREGKGFTSTESTLAGSFFNQKILGRSLARLDWNRDGRPDFVAGILDAPTQFVENRTETENHWISFRLIGIEGARDAIGAQVALTVGGRKQVRQLTAGDGYQASNEKKLLFGLGEFPLVESVSIVWPDGSKQTFLNMESETEYVICQSETQPIVIRVPTKNRRR